MTAWSAGPVAPLMVPSIPSLKEVPVGEVILKALMERVVLSINFWATGGMIP